MTEKVARLAAVDIPNERFTYVLLDTHRYKVEGDDYEYATEHVDVFTSDGVTRVVSKYGHELIFSDGILSHSKAVEQLGYEWNVNKKFLSEASNQVLLLCLEEFDEANDWSVLLPFFMEAEERLRKWGWAA